ncbi:MAG: DNA repair protein RecN [Propionibacteriaceae bacterium]|nr:DNA repair protein RecN [Propionibacteriaceae bacterium]
MLGELVIRQLGVIEEATFTPGPGLTVVTGETGAGKTMLILGLGMVLGVRADSSVVRNRIGIAQAIARFSDLPGDVAEAIDDVGGYLDHGELIVQRQVSSTGRSRSWVGGSSVNQGIAQDIGADLVTIHGQSEQIRLSTPERQREVLDRAAGPAMATALENYRAKYDQHKRLSGELEELTQSARERAREVDMLSFGLAEITKVDPQDGEDDALIAESRRLQDADELRDLAYTTMVALSGEEVSDSGGVLHGLTTSIKALEKVAGLDPKAQELVSSAQEVSALASDLTSQVSAYLGGLDADPVRLEWIGHRLAEIKSLTRKYGADATAVRAWAQDAENQLSQLGDSDDKITELTEEITGLELELNALADQMSQMRRDTSRKFSDQIGEELAALAMPHAKVEFRLSTLGELGPTGRDGVTLLFTANPGSDPAPLSKVASGGELSRVRLAIEVVLADSSLKQTFVFDEVDAGIGGAVGLQVGQRLAKLAAAGQVIVVTHLAQVAAFAHTHVVVEKTDNGDVTSSGLFLVEGDQRLSELARMMGGLDESSHSLAHASDLVNQAQMMMASI